MDKKNVINKSLDQLSGKKWHLPLEEVVDVELSDDYVNQANLIEQLHQEIKKLSDGCRAILVLFPFEGFKHSEIAKN